MSLMAQLIWTLVATVALILGLEMLFVYSVFHITGFLLCMVSLGRLYEIVALKYPDRLYIPRVRRLDLRPSGAYKPPAAGNDDSGPWPYVPFPPGWHASP